VPGAFASPAPRKESAIRIIDWFSANKTLAGQVAVLSVAVALLYAVLTVLLIVRMSPDYFISRRPAEGTWRRQHPVIRLLVRVVKNAVGAVFVLAGLAMLVLPGQGALTVVVGLTLLDLPGKRKMALRIVRQRHVLQAINWIRSLARRPPLVLPPVDRPRGEAPPAT
jgi:hypothetical protein